jgi:RND family efflux transporter MFP subunit
MRVILLFLAFAIAGCTSQQKTETPVERKEPAQVVHAEMRHGTLEVAGTVRSANVAELASRYGGYVQKVNVHAGSKVRRGDLLVLLDDRSLDAQSQKATAAEKEIREGIEEARQNVLATEAQRELAVNTFERIRALYERKSASKQEFEEALTRKESAEASYEAAKRRLAQMDSRLAQVKADRQEVSAGLSYQRIAAPFDGIIASVPAEQGTFARPGEILAIVEDSGPHQFVFSVEENLLPVVSGKVWISIPSASDKLLQGEILEVSPSSDMGTRTFRVKAALPDIPNLRSGISGTVQFQSPSKSIWIPLSYLILKNDLETVMVRQGREWRRVLVKSGNRTGDQVEILSGISAGDELGLFDETGE